MNTTMEKRLKRLEEKRRLLIEKAPERRKWEIESLTTIIADTKEYIRYLNGEKSKK